MFRVPQKLDLIRKQVKGWKIFTFMDIFIEKKEINSKLEAIKVSLAKGGY